MRLHLIGVTAAGLVWCAVFLVGAVLQIATTTQIDVIRTGVDANHAVPIVAFLLAFAFMVWSLQCNITQPIWRQIGMMTYPLYLLHNVVGAALIGVLVRAGMAYVPAIIVVSVVMIVASWVIATRAEPVVRRFADTLLSRVGFGRFDPGPRGDCTHARR